MSLFHSKVSFSNLMSQLLFTVRKESSKIQSHSLRTSDIHCIHQEKWENCRTVRIVHKALCGHIKKESERPMYVVNSEFHINSHAPNWKFINSNICALFIRIHLHVRWCILITNRFKQMLVDSETGCFLPKIENHTNIECSTWNSYMLRVCVLYIGLWGICMTFLAKKNNSIENFSPKHGITCEIQAQPTHLNPSQKLSWLKYCFGKCLFSHLSFLNFSCLPLLARFYLRCNVSWHNWIVCVEHSSNKSTPGTNVRRVGRTPHTTNTQTHTHTTLKRGMKKSRAKWNNKIERLVHMWHNNFKIAHGSNIIPSTHFFISFVVYSWSSSLLIYLRSPLLTTSFIPRSMDGTCWCEHIEMFAHKQTLTHNTENPFQNHSQYFSCYAWTILGFSAVSVWSMFVCWFIIIYQHSSLLPLYWYCCGCCCYCCCCFPLSYLERYIFSSWQRWL